ncbi:hypothetical protein H4N54_04225, partial [Limnospira fusiformis KN01]
DGVFGLRPATEPPAWVAPYDYGKEAGRGERFNTTAEKAIALGSRWAIASFPKHRKLLGKGDRLLYVWLVFSVFTGRYNYHNF